MPRPIHYPRIASRVYNTPLLLRPDTAELISSVLAERLGVEASLHVQQAALAPTKAGIFDDEEDDDPVVDPPLPYQITKGVATIQITGELVNRGSWIDAVSGLTSYARVSGALQHAANNDAVTGILLDIDSPGGEASGAMELGALVRKISEAKPVTAFVDGQACSAAYAIACGAAQIVATPSATLGSIGVVLLHIDRSAQMEKAGLKPTLIQKGKYKTDGTSVKPLSDDAIARLDGYLDVLYGLFVSSVATHRASLSEESVRNTEAGLFIGQSAIAIGLADKVGTLDDALATLPRAPQATGMTFPVFGGGNMSVSATSPVHPAPPVAGASIPDPGTTVAAPAALASAPAALIPPAASAPESRMSERNRISAILGHTEAKGREGLAHHFAFDTDMAPEAAVAALAKAPKGGHEQPAAEGGRLLAEMSALTAPVLGSPAADAAAAAAAADANAGKTKFEIEYEEGRRSAAAILGKKIS